MCVLATNWRYFMKKISLMVFLSVLVGALSACSNDLGHSMTGIQVKMVGVSPPLSANWPTTGLVARPSDTPAVYTFWVANYSQTPYYGGTWVITMPDSEHTHHDGQASPLMPGETRRVELRVPRGNLRTNSSDLAIPLTHPMGMAMWRDIRALGIETVSVRISEFDPAVVR
jgi:hypothetical protein